MFITLAACLLAAALLSPTSFAEDWPMWGGGPGRNMVSDGCVASDGSKATIRGKVWKKAEAEPAEWTIEAEDTLPHTSGSPGIYGYSAADILYDNIQVTPAGR